MQWQGTPFPQIPWQLASQGVPRCQPMHHASPLKRVWHRDPGWWVQLSRALSRFIPPSRSISLEACLFLRHLQVSICKRAVSPGSRRTTVSCPGITTPSWLGWIRCQTLLQAGPLFMGVRGRGYCVQASFQGPGCRFYFALGLPGCLRLQVVTGIPCFSPGPSWKLTRRLRRLLILPKK